MKYSTIKSLMAAVCIAAPAAMSAVTVDILPLPSGVTVTPAQGVIDTGINESPLGAGTVAFSFGGQTLQVNNECTDVISIYVDGSGTPAESIQLPDAHAVTVDDKTMRKNGGIFFNRVYTDPGTYHIVIPEGIFLIGEENPTLSPAMELNYAIEKDYLITPSPGVTDGIENIQLSFPQATKVEIVNPGGIEFQLVGSSSNYQGTIDIMNDSEGIPNIMRVQFSDGPISMEIFTQPGQYLLLIPAGAIRYTLMEDGKEITKSNKELRFQYYIAGMPPFKIDPEENSELESVFTFTLDYPDKYTVTMPWNTMERAQLFPVSEDGTLLSNPTATFRGTIKDGKLVYRLCETGKLTFANEPIVPEKGRYALQLAPAVTFGTYGNWTGASEPFVYYYEMKGPADSVEALLGEETATSFDVYSLTGIAVGLGLNQAEVDALAPGFYIINGEKVVKTNR